MLITKQEISKSIPEEKDIDEYSNNKTPKKVVHNKPISGRKRRGSEVPLQSIDCNVNGNKRHCDNDHNNSNQMMMMIIDSPTNNNRNDINNRNDELINYQQINNGLNIENSELKQKLSDIQRKLMKQMEITNKYETEKERNNRACGSLKLLLNQIAISERQERESRLLEDNKLIGRVVQCHSNNFGQVSDIWEDGQLFEDLKRRKKELEKQKIEIENKKKEIRKLKSKRQKEKENEYLDNTGFVIPLSPKSLDQLSLEAEIASIRGSLIKKQLNELEVEYSTLEYRKKRHIKFIRLMRDEKKSRFSINKKHECYVLNDRYVLTNLLGRGGFSEVHRGYDLYEHKYIAAKIHQLNIHWSDERKKNYTKHATREYDIHKSLNHHNIVCLYDVFGIDVNSFCTVLEYCDGMDLDMYLKIHKVLTERESRSLIIQVFIGLKYLHNDGIIHYDLKPGNLLYKNGTIKLTDFGLAKIMNDPDSDLIELTSQGAGTYWYLPPECFITSNNNNHNEPIMISPKVDIWSCGVIFFQMLYGKRPFGDNMSQDSILNNKTILNARHVTFPSHPKSISKQAKDFISSCCAYEPSLRLSSNQIVDNHPYFGYLRK